MERVMADRFCRMFKWDGVEFVWVGWLTLRVSVVSDE